MAIPENAQLNAFLAEEARGTELPAETAPVETKPEATEGVKPEPAAKPETAPEETAQPEGDPPDPTHFRQLRDVVESTKREREDWKSKAVRAETERDELRRQLEEAKRPAAQQQPPQPIDPAQDPQGFTQRIQGVVLNERLNVSELLLRKELGAEKVDALIAEFKQAAQYDPSLFQKLYAQPDPYGWAAQQVEVMRLQREIGTDPAAYRARIEAEARAKWDAEHAANGNGAQQRQSPAAGMAPSLANARSVAGRSAPAFTGDLPLSEILALPRRH